VKKVTVYLCIDVLLDGIKGKYKCVADQFRTEPAVFCLPWTERAIPPVGAQISFKTMPVGADTFVVASQEYLYDPKKDEVRVEVNMKAENDPDLSRRSPDTFLNCAAETGVVVFSTWKPIKDVLREAGLLKPT
jgi:hypothetical protein